MVSWKLFIEKIDLKKICKSKLINGATTKNYKTTILSFKK